MQERLQKIIAQAGVTSRRAAEELILAGRVRVNGRIVTELGAKADPRGDTIEVDGRRLVAEAHRYIVLHKPRNVVSTLHDPEGRPTVAELLKGAGTRLYPVGRLDFATSGVLLATNDGEFANGLLHPRGGVPKTYVLKVKGVMTEEDLARWAAGVDLEDGRTLPAEVHRARHEDDKTWFEITIREGRNQQIRRMGEATGFPVMRLARTSFAGITHENLRPGDWRSLTVDELESLRKEFGVPKRIRGAVLGEHEEAPRRGRRPVSAAPPQERRGPSGRAAPRAGFGEHEGTSERRGRPAARAGFAEREGAAERRGPGRAAPRAERGGHEEARGGDRRRGPAPKRWTGGEQEEARSGERRRAPAPPERRSGGREETRGGRGRGPAPERRAGVERSDARGGAGRRERAPAPRAEREEARAGDRRRTPAPDRGAAGARPRAGREAPKASGTKRSPRRRGD